MKVYNMMKENEFFVLFPFLFLLLFFGEITWSSNEIYLALVSIEFCQDGRVNALYSTPSLYTDAKNAAEETWPLKTDDFFP